MTQITVRQAQVSDAQDLVPLLATLGYPAPPEEVTRRLEIHQSNAEASVFVAEDEGRLVGLAAMRIMALLHYANPMARITAFVVAEDYQRRGVGQSLLQAVEAQARVMGCTRVEVTSAEHRTGAHRFYANAGFKTASLRFLKSL